MSKGGGSGGAVTIYCRCNGCDHECVLKREATLAYLPRIGEEVDGVTVRKIKHTTATGRITIFTSNTDNIARYPDSAQPFAQRMITTYGYTACDHDEWYAEYFA